MKKLFTAILAALTAATLFAAPAAQAEGGYINQTDIDAINKVSSLSTTFQEVYADANTTREAVSQKAAALSKAFGELIDHEFNTTIGQDYTKHTETLKAAAREAKKSLDNLQTSLTAQDEAGLAQFETSYNTQIDAYNKAAANMNASVEVRNASEGTLYLSMLVGTGVLTVAAFLWAFMGGKKQSSPELAKARQAVAFTSIAPLVGAGITYVSFLFADQLGGSYYIAYGPILFGAVIFIQSIVQYLKAKKQPKQSVPAQ